MTKKYTAISFAPDGDYITEGEYETIEQAWDVINDWGSRWFFYPFPAVATNKTIVSTCDGMEEWKNKRITTIQKILKKYPMRTCDTREEARQYAIDWQLWASEQNMSYGELAEWQDIFEQLAQKYNLTDEFKENGII